MTTNPKTQVLLTGATGYIGGSVLVRLLEHPDIASFDITVVVRSQEKADVLSGKFGVKVAVGSHSDPSFLTPLAKGSDIVIATAGAEDIEAAKGTLAGLKQRFEATGVPPILIHTSGTGVFFDSAGGDTTTDVIYDDLNTEQIEGKIQRNVDIEVARAGKEGYVRTYVVFPSMVYGLATGPLVDAGIQSRHSMAIPMYIRTALSRGSPFKIGKGVNVWPHVSIRDTADFYITLFSAILKTPEQVGHGPDGYYILENGEISKKELTKVIGEGLVNAGKATQAEPTSLSEQELLQYFGGFKILGSNDRCVGHRAKALGWTPKDGKDALLESIPGEIDALGKKI